MPLPGRVETGEARSCAAPGGAVPVAALRTGGAPPLAELPTGGSHSHGAIFTGDCNRAYEPGCMTADHRAPSGTSQYQRLLARCMPVAPGGTIAPVIPSRYTGPRVALRGVTSSPRNERTSTGVGVRRPLTVRALVLAFHLHRRRMRKRQHDGQPMPPRPWSTSAVTNEICMATGYYCPATKPLLCINNTGPF